MIKKLFGALALVLSCGTAVVHAADAGYPLESAPKPVTDLGALQNGAKIFVNYCLSCHSASAVRYNKLLQIGLTEEQIKNSLLFTGEGVGDMMDIAMTPKDAKAWLGTTPPDLSVIARAKSTNAGPSGADYIYTYLRTFYRDTSKATGWDNLVFPSVGMPHVMWDVQGPRTLTTTTVHQVSSDPANPEAPKVWERVTVTYDQDGYATSQKETLQGEAHASFDAKFTSLNPEKDAAFDMDVADLTAFLAWMSEPVQQDRKLIGIWVMLFLFIFLFVAYRLNAAFWKDVR
ncbi:MAG: cytochrome c1 [Corticimicrobacter sp.]|uniref:cytochrome c1 n=1 Tax=Corticimicrobacter sp. TaxID=2678536 RepID=UPI0032DAE210